MTLSLIAGPDAFLRVSLSVNVLILQTQDHFNNLKNSVNHQIDRFHQERTEIPYLQVRIAILFALKVGAIIASGFYVKKLSDHVFYYTASKIGLNANFSLFRTDGPPLTDKLVPWSTFFLASYGLGIVINQILNPLLKIVEAPLTTSISKTPILIKLREINELEKVYQTAKHIEELMTQHLDAIQQFSKKGGPTEDEIHHFVEELGEQVAQYKNLKEEYSKKIQTLWQEINISKNGWIVLISPYI